MSDQLIFSSSSLLRQMPGRELGPAGGYAYARCAGRPVAGQRQGRAGLTPAGGEDHDPVSAHVVLFSAHVVS
jgi:hypothetical protein